MPTKDPRIDAYIAKSAEFARPILQHWRKLVHKGCPKVVETVKWSAPFFEYKGILCGMAAFKAHCGFVFWRDIEVSLGTEAKNGKAMGQFGRVTSLKDLPPDGAVLKILKQAVALRDDPAPKKPSRPRRPAKEPAVPADLKRALARSAKAAKTFREFSPSHRREYVVWITEAKRPETRERRLETALEWLAEGKSQNWRYETRSRAGR